MHVSIKNGQHNHKVIVAANVLAHACMQHRAYLNKFYTACIMLRCMLHCWGNSPKAYSKRSVLGLACESTFWLILIPSLPQCLSWFYMHVVCAVLYISLWKPFSSLESLMITTLRLVRITTSMNMVRSRGGAPGVVKVTNPYIQQSVYPWC